MSEFEVDTKGIPAVADKSSVDAGSVPDSALVDGQVLLSASSTTPPVRQSPIASPCRFFMMGTCRHGSECRFSHDPALCAQNAPPPTPQFYGNPQTGAQGAQKSPPFVIVQPPPGHPIFSIDVECVATGVQHNARSIAQVALVDEWSRPIFNVLIRQQVPVVSYITPLTGLTKEMIEEHGLPLADALALLRAVLPPHAILVGQNILKDVQWLQLAESVDYHSLIDISALFRVWNPQRNENTSFSQDHCAKVWLGIEQRPSHNAVQDAQISMSLFNAYRSIQWDPNRMYQMQQLTLNTTRIPGFSSLNPTVDGCCMGNHKKCTCGAPFL